MIVVYIQAGFVLINLAMAWWHSRLIKQHKKIRHGLWAALYILAIGAVCVLMKNWYFGPALLFIRPLTFDPFLNVLRKLPITYTPKKPEVNFG